MADPTDKNQPEPEQEPENKKPEPGLRSVSVRSTLPSWRAFRTGGGGGGIVVGGGGGGGGGLAPAAPNVTATMAIRYEHSSHNTIPVFYGTITYPISDPNYDQHWQSVYIDFIYSGDQLPENKGKAINLNSYPKATDSGGTYLATAPWSGKNGDLVMSFTAQTNCKLRFTSYNEDSNDTSPPFYTAAFTLPALAISSLTATDNGSARWKDPISQALHAVLDIALTLSVAPVYVTIWTKSPQYGLIWHGWPDAETSTDTIHIGAQGTPTTIYPPTDTTSEVVDVWVAIGTYDASRNPQDPDVNNPAKPDKYIPGLQHTTVTIASAPAPSANDSTAYIESGDPTNHVRYYDTGGGMHNFGWVAIHFTVGGTGSVITGLDDPNLWFIRFHMQSGAVVGGVWTPGGQFGGSENGIPGVGIGDWDTDEDHNSWIERVGTSNTLLVHDNGGWAVPTDGNNTFRVIATITTRRGGPAGTTTQQSGWSSGVDVTTPGTLDHQDVVTDPTKGQTGQVIGATVTDINAVEIGPRYTDRDNVGTHTVIRLTPTLNNPTLGNDVTFWVQFGDGKWSRQGVWHIDDKVTHITLGEQTLDTEGVSGSGSIWVPTSTKRSNWVAAAKEGDISSDDPPAGALPAGAPTVTFTVPPVGACLPDDITGIQFLTNPDTSDQMVYVLKDTWKWFYFELDLTQPTFEHDNNYWSAIVTYEDGYTDTGGVWHSAPNQGVTDDHSSSLYQGRKHVDLGEMAGGHPIYGSTVQLKGGDISDYWDAPPLDNLNNTPFLYRSKKFRVYAISRLGTDADGGGGDDVFTLQVGWPGGADHYIITPNKAKMPPPFNLKNTNPDTSFDPLAPLTGGGGVPVSVAVAEPLAIYSKALTLSLAASGGGVDSQWLKDGAVIASKTALDAINAATGMLKANAVVCGLVDLPVSQQVAGSAIFTGDVYLSRGSGLPAMKLSNDGIWLFSGATASTGGTPTPCTARVNTVTEILSQPWTSIQSTQILMYGGGTVSGTAPSYTYAGPGTQILGTGIILYQKLADNTQPRFAVQASALSFYNPPYFSMNIGASQIQLVYDNTGSICGTPVTPAPSQTALFTNTINSGGIKMMYTLGPPASVKPSVILSPSVVQFWTKDNDSSKPCIGIQDGLMNLTYGQFQTLMAASNIVLQYSTVTSVTLTSADIKIAHSSNASSITLDNTGTANFVKSSTTTTISGGALATVNLATNLLNASGQCAFATSGSNTVSMGATGTTATTLLVNSGNMRSTAQPSPYEWLPITVNGQARYIPLHLFG